MKNVYGTTEFIATSPDNNKRDVKLWINEELRFDQTIDKSDANIKTSEIKPKVSWSCINDCLASQGIASWILYMAGIACAATCTIAGPITGGSACWACINGLGMIDVQQFFYCTDRC